jgi:hypothetical protein
MRTIRVHGALDIQCLALMPQSHASFMWRILNAKPDGGSRGWQGSAFEMTERMAPLQGVQQTAAVRLVRTDQSTDSATLIFLNLSALSRSSGRCSTLEQRPVRAATDIPADTDAQSLPRCTRPKSDLRRSARVGGSTHYTGLLRALRRRGLRSTSAPAFAGRNMSEELDDARPGTH